MLGSACFRLCSRTSVALLKSHHSSPHPYLNQAITKPHVGSPTSFRNRSQVRQLNGEVCNLQSLHTVKRSCCHTSSYYVEGGHELKCATIWHGLLPSHHPSIFKALNVSSGGVLHGLTLPHHSVAGLGRLAMTTSLVDGSWNVAWDARPARWLHGRDSAWLLFGVCGCCSNVSPRLPNSPTYADANTGHRHAEVDSGCGCNVEAASKGNRTYAGYTVTGIPGDGRCLFRAIAYGACVRSGKPTPKEDLQQEIADDLRNKVVDELVRRRSESEWFIEEDFDTYVKRMREPYVWGGEPELLMASHVLKMPITVHLQDKGSRGLISMAEYGLEYGNQNPVRVLYYGFGHYDSLQFEGEELTSRPS